MLLLCRKEEKLTGLSCQTMMTLSSSPDASRLPSGLHLNSYNIHRTYGRRLCTVFRIRISLMRIQIRIQGFWTQLKMQIRVFAPSTVHTRYGKQNTVKFGFFLHNDILRCFLKDTFTTAPLLTYGDKCSWEYKSEVGRGRGRRCFLLVWCPLYPSLLDFPTNPTVKDGPDASPAS